MVLVFLQVSATHCTAGFCAVQSDATSLVQVMQVVKPQIDTAHVLKENMPDKQKHDRKPKDKGHHWHSSRRQPRKVQIDHPRFRKRYLRRFQRKFMNKGHHIHRALEGRRSTPVPLVHAGPEQTFERSMRNAEGLGYNSALGEEARAAKKAIDFKRSLEHRYGQERENLWHAYNAQEDQMRRTIMQKRDAEQEAIREVAQAKQNMVKTALKKMQTERAVITGEMEGERLAVQRAAGEKNQFLNSFEREMRLDKHAERRTDAHFAEEVKRKVAQRYAAGKDSERRQYLNHLTGEMDAWKHKAATYASTAQDVFMGPGEMDTRMLKTEAEQTAAAFNRQADQDKRTIAEIASGRL